MNAGVVGATGAVFLGGGVLCHPFHLSSVTVASNGREGVDLLVANCLPLQAWDRLASLVG